MNLKEENEKLREILRDVRPVICNAGYYSLAARIDSALSQQGKQLRCSLAQDEREASQVGAEWQRTRPAQKVNNVNTPEQQPELVMPVALGSVNADYDQGWADHAAEVVRLNAALANKT